MCSELCEPLLSQSEAAEKVYSELCKPSPSQSEAAEKVYSELCKPLLSQSEAEEKVCSELCEPLLSQSEEKVEFLKAKNAIKLKVCGLALFPDLKTKCGRPVCYSSWCSPWVRPAYFWERYMYCACVACHQGVTEWAVLIGYFSFVRIATCTTDKKWHSAP